MNTFLNPYLTQPQFFGTPFGYQYPGFNTPQQPFGLPLVNAWQILALQNQAYQNQALQNQFSPFINPLATQFPQAWNAPQFWNTIPTNLNTISFPVGLPTGIPTGTFLPGLPINNLGVNNFNANTLPITNLTNPLAFTQGFPGLANFTQPTFGAFNPLATFPQVAQVPQLNTPLASPINTISPVLNGLNGLNGLPTQPVHGMIHNVPNTPVPTPVPTTIPTNAYPTANIPTGYGIFGTSYFGHTPLLNQFPNPFINQFPVVNPQLVNPFFNQPNLFNPQLNPQFNPWLNTMPASPTTYSTPVAIETETTQKRAVARNVG